MLMFGDAIQNGYYNMFIFIMIATVVVGLWNSFEEGTRLP